MRSFRLILLLWVISTISNSASAQLIRGAVIDMKSRKALQEVSIANIHTSITVYSNTNGEFELDATNDQLLEFKKNGYKTVKVRIPRGYIPSFFKIILEPGFKKMEPANLKENENGRYDYHDDSLRFYSLYKHELEFERLSAIQSIAHPFSALSKRNREIWQFQDSYAAFEKEKYVDKTFNERLVNRFTGLSGDSLKVYMVRYRPTYEQLKNMSDYAYFSFIKRTVNTFRNGGDRPRNAQ